MSETMSLSMPRVSSKAMPMVVVSTVFQTLAIFAVFLRFISKGTNKGVGLDDWLALLALVFSLGLYICGLLICTIGYAGIHTIELNFAQIDKFLLIVYIDNIFYALTLSTIKLSILIMYRRIFSRTKRFLYALYAVGFLVIGWMIGVVSTQILTCNPVNAAWDIKAQVLGAKCINQTSFYFGNSVSNIIVDFIILCMPIPIIWQLKMTAHKKAALTGVFLLGGFVIISSICRTVSLGKIVGADITYTLVDVGIWTSTETPLAIVCACLPMLPALFKSWQKKIAGSSTLRSLRSKNTSTGLTSKSNCKSDYENLEEGGMPLTTISAVQQKYGEDLEDDGLESQQIHVEREITVETRQDL